MTRRNAVVVVADEIQLPPAAFLASRLRQLNPRGDTDIVLATNAPAALAVARNALPGVTLLDLSEVDRRQNLPVHSYFTRATYLRLFLPALLRRTHARIVYLDADVYSQTAGVFRLLDLAMGGEAIAAVRDLTVAFFLNDHNTAELRDTLGLMPDAMSGPKYLNSGVLLIDVDAFLAARIDRRAMALLAARKAAPRMLDQSLLNAVLRGRWLELSPAFNMITRAWRSPIRAYAPPALVHFTGGVKPWHSTFVADHPVRDELRAFLAASPWSDFIRRSNPIVLGAPSQRPPPEPDRPIWFGRSLADLDRHLRATPFADVEQGLTTLHPEALEKLRP